MLEVREVRVRLRGRINIRTIVVRSIMVELSGSERMDVATLDIDDLEAERELQDSPRPDSQSLLGEHLEL